MRRTVWIVVLGLLVLAVVAQSVALVPRPAYGRIHGYFTSMPMDGSGRFVSRRRD